jgi:hypothetical protein
VTDQIQFVWQLCPLIILSFSQSMILVLCNR